MKKKILAIIVCMLLITNAIIIISHDTKVEATPGGGSAEGDIGLDYQYIRNITENLSYVIFNAYNETELRKGRSFGSKGENYAADQIIKLEMMNNLNLYNPGLDPPYLEQIENIRSGFDHETPSVNLTEQLDTLSFGITVYNETNNTNVTLSEFHIQPMWNWRLLLFIWEYFFPNLNLDECLEWIESTFHINTSNYYIYNYIFNESWLTKNVSYNHLSLAPRPHNVSWLLEFLEDKIEEISCNESIVDYPSLMYYLLPEFQEYYNFTFGELHSMNASRLPKFIAQWMPSTIGDEEDFLFID